MAAPGPPGAPVGAGAGRGGPPVAPVAPVAAVTAGAVAGTAAGASRRRGTASRGRGGRGTGGRGTGGRGVRFSDIQNHIDAHNNGDGSNLKYTEALKEIKNCNKQSDWIWYIFPQVKGLSTTTPNPGNNQGKYDIKDLDHAKNFLRDNTLRQNYLKISQAVLTCLKNSNTLKGIFNGDDKKVISSWTLFHYAAKEKLKDNKPNEKDNLDEIIQTIEEAKTKGYFNDYDSNTYSKLGSQPTTAATATATATTAATSGGPPPTSTATTATPTTTTIRTPFIPVTSPTPYQSSDPYETKKVPINGVDIKFKIYTAKDKTEIYEFTSDAEKDKMIQELKSYY